MSTGEKIFSGIKIGFKILGASIIILVYVLCFVRMCNIGGMPEEIENIKVTPEMIDIYNSDGGKDRFVCQSINKFNANDDSYGYFSVQKYFILEGADKVYMVFRMNKSTLENVAEDYGLSEPIGREEKDVFELSLVVKNAIGDIVLAETDESGVSFNPVDYNGDDNEGKTYTLERIFPSDAEYFVEGRYNYIKLTFNKVDFDRNVTLGIFLDINYKDDIRYEKPQEKDPEKMQESYGRICIYNYTSPNKDYKFTSADKSALDRSK